MSRVENYFAAIIRRIKQSYTWRRNDFWYHKFLSSPGNDWLGVTYANDKHTDGCGSQLQRVYGIYSLSRFLKLPYIHSSLAEVNYCDFDTLTIKPTGQDLMSEYNNVFCLPSDRQLPKDHVILELSRPEIKTLYQLKRRAARSKTFTLVRITYPYGITDLYPDAYQVVKKASPYRREKSGPFRIAIHVRRGELPLIAPERMLPNEYYLAVAQKVRGILEDLKVDYRFELYTEVASQNVKANKLEEFGAIPNVTIFINSDPIKPIEKMATADVVIISHSSYSYFASLLNVNGTIIYHPFWSRPLSDWVISDDLGNFSKQKFLEQSKLSDQIVR
jgi:hypothetical protein